MSLPPDSDLIQKKVANGFYTNKQLASTGHGSGDLGSILLSLFMGGVWLGGNVTLTSTKIIFELNAVNKFFGSGDSRVEIPLAEISQVTVKGSIGFKIIHMTNPQGDFKIRVRGAKEFASLIEETIAKAKVAIERKTD